MILFFDTETTGLPKDWKTLASKSDNWPKMVQLAYQLYDWNGNLKLTGNEIIKPEGFNISKNASGVHGITDNIALSKGSDLNDVLNTFLSILERAQLVVCHNVHFDENVVASEFLRLGYKNPLRKKEKFCTMISTVELCRIKSRKFGEYKWPSLKELHKFLFKKEFDDAHNALIDVEATVRCFWELYKRKLINPPGLRPRVFGGVPTQKQLDAFLIVPSKKQVPFLKINKAGKQTWRLYDIKCKNFSRTHDDLGGLFDATKDLKVFQDNPLLYSEFNDIKENGKSASTNSWNGWHIENGKGLWGDLYFHDKLVLILEEHFANRETHYIAVYNSESKISKLMSRNIWGDEDGGGGECYETIFFIDKKGNIYLDDEMEGEDFRVIDYDVLIDDDPRDYYDDQNFLYGEYLDFRDSIGDDD